MREGRCGVFLSLVLALGLCGCGPREAGTSVKREGAKVNTETGPLPAAGTANRLINEQSAFLRHHAQDPVDWYPWGEEAFRKAQKEQKLILVSVGYASCPWSQKMQEESFTDPVVARFMNKHYVNVLVDREERPDVNNSYLHFLFWKNKQSGWPLHMWLTPEGLPVFAGVYFPVNSEGDAPSWSLTMEHVADNFESDRAYVRSQAELTAKDYLKQYRKFWRGTEVPLTEEGVAMAFDKMRAVYDPVSGGFSGAPKFAQPQALTFLLSYAVKLGEDRMGRGKEAREMAAHTLDRILAGGIHDQLGGGIHRYSTDSYWAVPQFEKMLYDQGFFAGLLVDAAATLGRAEYAEAARRTLGYAMKELGHPEGGFYCAEGSSSLAKAGDTSMSEGAFYLWQLSEVEKAAGEKALPLLRLAYGLEERGNMPIDSPVRGRFPGANVLKMERPMAEVVKLSGKTAGVVAKELEESREKLLKAREQRPRPLLDDKVLASWNGAVIEALAKGALVFDDEALRKRAVRAMDFVLNRLRREDGTLVHAFLDGPSSAPGYAEDYALVIRALLQMYETTGSVKWLKMAVELQDKQIELLWDKVDGAFFDGPPQPLLFNRMKSVDESTEFAPNACSAENLLSLGALLGRADYKEKAETVFKIYGSLAMQSPGGFLRFLLAYDSMKHPPVEVVVVGGAEDPARKALLDGLRGQTAFGRRLVYLDGGEDGEWLVKTNPAIAEMATGAGSGAAVYFCRDFKVVGSCTRAEELEGAMARAKARGANP